MKARSMKQAVPRLIVGSPHRHLTVAREVLCSSLDGPVASRTLLGWTLEGAIRGKGTGISCCVVGDGAGLQSQPQSSRADNLDIGWRGNKGKTTRPKQTFKKQSPCGFQDWKSAVLTSNLGAGVEKPASRKERKGIGHRALIAR
ncbi:unnamed protein product [Orchesella dallaii]|uniref:Uncharacterized protein n=1 Tax=Orchesella dallaii TaxID=48710 RepID=A0ABP1R3E9_9HEXA